MTTFHGTTILGVRKDGRVALGGDGQVSMGETVFKSYGSKVRTLKGGKVLAGFAREAAHSGQNRQSICPVPPFSLTEAAGCPSLVTLFRGAS